MRSGAGSTGFDPTRRARRVARVLAAVALLGAALPAAARGEDASPPCAPPARPTSGEGTTSVARPGPAQAVIAAFSYPGLGQLVVGSEKKAVLVGAAQAFLVGSLVLEDRWTRHALRLYRETGEVTYYDEYSSHYDRRQTLVWWVAVVGLLSVADAYVDAHLTGFGSPGPFASLEGPYPAAHGDGVRLGLAIEF